MMWKISVLLICCLGSTINGQDYDCDQAPPTSVEPLTCCKISKPFDRKNFPECFVDPVLITTTSIPSTLSSTIPVNKVNDDYDNPIRSNSGYNKNRVNGILDRKNEKRRNNGNNRYNNGNDEDNYRGDSSNNLEQRRTNSSNDKTNGNDDIEYNYPWKHHHDHHHDHHHHWGWGDHRFGAYYGSRHRRQAIFQPSSFRTQCAIECIFNQTGIFSNGRFDRDIALDVYADYYPEIPIDLLTQTIEKCSRQLRNYRLGNRRRNRNPNYNSNLPNRQCRNGSGLFATCFNREIYRNCPAELDNDSEDCLSLRTFIDNCSSTRGTREIGGIANVDVDEYGNIILDHLLN